MTNEFKDRAKPFLVSRLYAGVITQEEFIEKFEKAVREDCKPTDETSDGYHTFNELYEHRHALFLALMSENKGFAWMSRCHDDGSATEGWFVAGIHLPGVGMVTYHLPERLWDMALRTDCDVVATAPKWDGHTSADVVERLKKWSARQ